MELLENAREYLRKKAAAIAFPEPQEIGDKLLQGEGIQNELFSIFRNLRQKAYEKGHKALTGKEYTPEELAQLQNEFAQSDLMASMFPVKGEIALSRHLQKTKGISKAEADASANIFKKATSPIEARNRVGGWTLQDYTNNLGTAREGLEYLKKIGKENSPEGLLLKYYLTAGAKKPAGNAFKFPSRFDIVNFGESLGIPNADDLFEKIMGRGIESGMGRSKIEKEIRRDFYDTAVKQAQEPERLANELRISKMKKDTAEMSKHPNTFFEVGGTKNQPYVRVDQRSQRNATSSMVSDETKALSKMLEYRNNLKKELELGPYKPNFSEEQKANYKYMNKYANEYEKKKQNLEGLLEKAKLPPIRSESEAIFPMTKATPISAPEVSTEQVGETIDKIAKEGKAFKKAEEKRILDEASQNWSMNHGGKPIPEEKIPSFMEGVFSKFQAIPDANVLAEAERLRRAKQIDEILKTPASSLDPNYHQKAIDAINAKKPWR